MIRYIRLTFTFYNTYSISSIVISLLSAGILRIGGMSFLVIVFWFKLISMGFIRIFINSYRKNEYFYYQNLGLSKTALWTGSFVFDFVLFLTLIWGAYHLR